MNGYTSIRGRADQIERMLQRKKGNFKEELKMDFSHWSEEQLRALVHWTPGVPYSEEIQQLLKGMGLNEPFR